MTDYKTLAEARVALDLPNPPRDATAKITGKTKDGKPFSYEVKYTSLDALIVHAKGPCRELGLAFYHIIRDGHVICVLVHGPSGEREESALPIQTQGPWTGIGSAITYAKRYTLAAMLGIASEEDDDGRAADQSTPGHNRSTEAKEPKKDQGRMHGPLSLTELKACMRQLAHDLGGVSDMDMLNGLMMGHIDPDKYPGLVMADVIAQCERDLPDWYYGRPQDESPGLSERLSEIRKELTKKESGM